MFGLNLKRYHDGDGDGIRVRFQIHLRQDYPESNWEIKQMSYPFELRMKLIIDLPVMSLQKILRFDWTTMDRKSERKTRRLSSTITASCGCI